MPAVTRPRGLQGLTPLASSVPGEMEATPEERYGGIADPRHGVPGETAEPYPWEVFPGQTHGPYGIENQLLSAYGLGVLAEPAGTLDQDPTADLQPLTHAAPWPKGIPQTVLPDAANLNRLQESADIHASDMGASRLAMYSPTLLGENDQWTEYRNDTPGESQLVPIPKQVMMSGGWGTTDRTQSMQEQNEYGFDTAHTHRRWATGAIPGNTMWMQPGGRPIVRNLPQAARVPVGKDSPFAGQVPGDAFSTQGAALYDLPTEYSGPPTPTLAPAYSGSGSVPNIPLW